MYFVLTGKCPGYERADLISWLNRLGHTIEAAVSDRTQVLVASENALRTNTRKAEAAQLRGIRLWSYTLLLERIEIQSRGGSTIEEFYRICVNPPRSVPPPIRPAHQSAADIQRLADLATRSAPGGRAIQHPTPIRARIDRNPVPAFRGNTTRRVMPEPMGPGWTPFSTSVFATLAGEPDVVQFGFAMMVQDRGVCQLFWMNHQGQDLFKIITDPENDPTGEIFSDFSDLVAELREIYRPEAAEPVAAPVAFTGRPVRRVL